jgi:hypothetical protein
VRKPPALIALVTSLVLLGIGAILGGGALCISPGGELLAMPPSLLRDTPFRDYLIPGLILFSVIGVFPLLAAYALLRKPDWHALRAANPFRGRHWAWAASAMSGVSLVVWIVAEMVLLRIAVWIHWVYLLWGLAIAGLTSLKSVREYCAAKPAAALPMRDEPARRDS